MDSREDTKDPEPKAGAPSEEVSDAKVLQLILRALERYPDPVPIPAPANPQPGDAPAPPRFVYVPPLDLAITLFAQRFQRTDEATLITEAFAAVAPKVLDRCQAHIAASMNAIVDGTACGAEMRNEYLTLMGELSTLATMFVGPPPEAFGGPYAPQYTAVCDMMQGLMAASPK